MNIKCVTNYFHMFYDFQNPYLNCKSLFMGFEVEFWLYAYWGRLTLVKFFTIYSFICWMTYAFVYIFWKNTFYWKFWCILCMLKCFNEVVSEWNNKRQFCNIDKNELLWLGWVITFSSQEAILSQWLEKWLWIALNILLLIIWCINIQIWNAFSLFIEDLMIAGPLRLDHFYPS